MRRGEGGGGGMGFLLQLHKIGCFVPRRRGTKERHLSGHSKPGRANRGGCQGRVEDC